MIKSLLRNRDIRQWRTQRAPDVPSLRRYNTAVKNVNNLLTVGVRKRLPRRNSRLSGPHNRDDSSVLAPRILGMVFMTDVEG